MNRNLLLQILADALNGTLRDGDPRLSEVELELVPVAGRVHVVRGAGANVGVLPTPDGCLLVDTAFAPLVPRIRAALRALPGSGRVRWVVDTHWHADHSHGNSAVAGEATLIAHAATRQRLAAWQAGLSKGSAPPALPALTFEDALTLHLPGEEVRVWHFGPAHTDGDVVVYFAGSNVLQAGDLFVTYGLPFVDVSSGGSVRGTARALERVLRDLPADVKVIPGHGPVSSRGDALAFASMLVDCVERVRVAHRSGLTQEEMLAQGVLGDHAARSNPFVDTRAFLAMVHEEVADESEKATF